MTSDKETIIACCSGAVNEYRFLVEKYKVRAYYAALLYTHNRDDALELSQEAFYRAYRALPQFDTNKNFYTWFYQILKNLCLNFVTRKKKNISFEDESEPGVLNLTNLSGEMNPEDIFERNEQSRMVWEAINKLGYKDREIIILKEFDDMSYQEIAEVLAIPIGSVMSRLYYARKKLLRHLEFLDE